MKKGTTKFKSNPDKDDFRAILNYNPDTGLFTWKKRPVEMFNHYKDPKTVAKEWNLFHEGKEAFCSKSETGYLSFGVFGGSFPAHRVAWLITYGHWPKQDIDHINRVTDDNRIINLRDVSRSVNIENTVSYKGSSSRFKNVSWAQQSQKWVATYKLNGKKIYLGSFKSEIEANDAIKQSKEN